MVVLFPQWLQNLCNDLSSVGANITIAVMNVQFTFKRTVIFMHLVQTIHPIRSNLIQIKRNQYFTTHGTYSALACTKVQHVQWLQNQLNGAVVPNQTITTLFKNQN